MQSVVIKRYRESGKVEFGKSDEVELTTRKPWTSKYGQTNLQTNTQPHFPQKRLHPFHTNYHGRPALQRNAEPQISIEITRRAVEARTL